MILLFSADRGVPECSGADVVNTLDICEAVVAPKNQPGAQFMGQGQETISAVLSSLLSDPGVRLLADPQKACFSLSKPKLSVSGPRLTFGINKQEAEK